MRSVLAATVAGERSPADALARLNAAARSAPAWWEVRWETERPDQPKRFGLAAQLRRRGNQAMGLLATLAEDTITLVTGEEAGQLRACPGPGCMGLYLQDKPQRRFCSPTCATRWRVARHYERRRRHPGHNKRNW